MNTHKNSKIIKQKKNTYNCGGYFRDLELGVNYGFFSLFGEGKDLCVK